MNKYLTLFFRIVVGAIFLWASFDKIIDPAKFARDISNYHIVPLGLENTIALILPWLEFFIGTGLIIGVMVDGSIIISSVLLITFNIMIAQAMARGFNIDCGCGLKEGQLSKVFGLKFKKELEKEGKKVQLFALTDITNERLRNLKGIDAFVQVACPRISTDNQFDKPVLSTPQANALLKILRNESIEGYLEIPHWL